LKEKLQFTVKSAFRERERQLILLFFKFEIFINK
jgi:hypothetical protein